MTKLKRLGKPPFLTAKHLKQSDILEIVNEPYVQSAKQSKFDRERGCAEVILLRTGEVYTYCMNTTTWDTLIDGFGDDSSSWIGKKIIIRLETQTVRGELRQVIYGSPHTDKEAKTKK